MAEEEEVAAAGDAKATAAKSETAAAEDSSLDMQSQIKDAMRSRVNHFKERSDSLTFEGVRRLLEKDLGLQEYALDVHKRFVKQCLLQCLDGVDEDNASKDSGETDEKVTASTIREAAESPQGHESKNEVKEPCSEDEDKMEDSPVMGLLTGKKTPKSETEETPDNKDGEVPSESSIRKALFKRAVYIKANSDKVTMAGLRRLLEGDLKLDKFALDPFKKFISTQLDEVLQNSEVSEPKKKTVKKFPQGKASKKMRTEESSDSSEGQTDEEDEVKPKKIAPKKKMLNSEGSNKRKRLKEETKVTTKKRAKLVETVAEESSDAEDNGNTSENSHSRSLSAKPVKKKETSTPAPVYGKHVEHLKSVIKSCGMSVPPVIYKKVKQVPENKREAQLIKELEEILSKEGLSSNPSEKEIKEVRKKKERAKELEGIDMSNIVSSSRRRSTTSYVPPPKPKIPVESDSDDVSDADDDDDDDDDNDDDDEEEENDDEEGDDGDNDGDDDSQSEDLKAENGEDSD